MAKKITQKQAILNHLLSGEIINGSSAYNLTKKECVSGTLNLHKLIALIRAEGYLIGEEWKYNTTTKKSFKNFFLLKTKKNGTKK